MSEKKSSFVNIILCYILDQKQYLYHT